MGGNCSIPDIIPYNRVETEREIPKLKFIMYSKAIGKQVYQAIGELHYILQEFQYGKETVQTTTSKSIIKEWEVKTLLAWLW